MQHLKS